MTQPGSLRSNMNDLIRGLKRTELGVNPLSSQKVELLEDELRHTRTQLEQKDKQHERVVEAWEQQVGELRTCLHTTHEAHTQSVNISDQLQSNLASLRGKLDLQEEIVRSKLTQLHVAQEEHREMANGHRERYRNLMIHEKDMENKLREGEAREAVLRDERSELETVCSELKESAK